MELTDNNTERRPLLWLALALLILGAVLGIWLFKPSGGTPEGAGHSNSIDITCNGWAVTAFIYPQGSTATVTIDGGAPIAVLPGNGAKSGSWDPSVAHHLVFTIDSSDNESEGTWVRDSTPCIVTTTTAAVTTTTTAVTTTTTPEVTTTTAPVATTTTEPTEVTVTVVEEPTTTTSPQQVSENPPSVVEDTPEVVEAPAAPAPAPALPATR